MTHTLALPAEPVASDARMHHVDTLRGIALLGVLIMNLHEWFRAPMQLYRITDHPWPGTLNLITDVFLQAFVHGKALTTFAMLFAVGICIQADRARATSGSYVPFGLRRMGALLLFGVAHILLVWNGDILHNYALVGLLCIPFLHRKPKTVMIWLISWFGLITLAMLVFSIVKAFGPSLFTGRSAAGLARNQALVEEMLKIRGQGTWTQEFFFRLKEYTQLWGFGGELGSTLDIFGKFLVGLAIWRSGVLSDPMAHRAKIRRFFLLMAPIALVMAAFSALPRLIPNPTPELWRVARFLLFPLGLSQVLGHITMALAYCSGVLLLLLNPAVARALSGFTAAGRMALTNYLTQSVVMTFVFFGWGLGLYNKLGPFAGVALSCAFFTLQVLFSRWWLAHHAYGPMEWVWRAITYGRSPKGRGAALPALVPAGRQASAPARV